MNPTASLAAIAVAFVMCGCTSLAEIRTLHRAGTDFPEINVEDPNPNPNPDSSAKVWCPSGQKTDANRAYSIEDYKDYWAGFVEFDDEGWLYRKPDEPSQMEVVQERLKRELKDPAFSGTDFVVVAFIHGWHHNAHDDDCNVHEFRAMLKIAQDKYTQLYKEQLQKPPSAQPPRPRRVVGIYVGWRGESLNIAGVRYTTVFDRRNAAERVAKGDVRRLFAVIRKAQFEADKTEPERMRTVVLGHSYGGLIAFHGLSPAVLNELTLTKPDTDLGCEPAVLRRRLPLRDDRAATQGAGSRAQAPTSIPAFPDMLVLINPAFEATRFEALHELMRPTPGCPYRKELPKVVVVTADNDEATGRIFTFERKVLTLLEAYPTDPRQGSMEREANTHAIGRVDRYRTHRLCLQEDANGKRAVAARSPPPNPDWDALDPYPPVWVVGAPPNVVYRHDGFLYAKPDSKAKPDPQQKPAPYLLNWLIALHTDGVGENSPAMTAKCSPEPPAAAQ